MRKVLKRGGAGRRKWGWFVTNKFYAYMELSFFEMFKGLYVLECYTFEQTKIIEMNTNLEKKDKRTLLTEKSRGMSTLW